MAKPDACVIYAVEYEPNPAREVAALLVLLGRRGARRAVEDAAAGQPAPPPVPSREPEAGDGR